MQTEFFNMMDRLLGDVCAPERLRQLEADTACRMPIWQALTDSGFLDMLLPNQDNELGGGLSWAMAWPVLFAAGRHAVPLPMGQTMWGRYLLAQWGETSIPTDAALALSGFGQRDEDGVVTARSVVGVGLADWVLVQVADEVFAAPVAQCSLEIVGGASSFEANISFEAERPVGKLPAGVLAQAVAVVLAVQMAGAADRVLEMTLAYANQRQQFGKPIGRFQALQQEIAEMSEHVYAMRMASQLGVQNDDWSGETLQAALAKSQSSASAARVARIAHAVHGAIGVTREYDLQFLTRKLYEWARAGGGEQYWAAHIGQSALQQASSPLDFTRRTIFAVNSFDQPAA